MQRGSASLGLALAAALACGEAAAQQQAPQASQKPPATQEHPLPEGSPSAQDPLPGPRAPAFRPLPPAQEALPTLAELEAAGAVIGRIVVNPQQIFDLDDPRESGWFYRLANSLHVRTRPEVIERELLFKPGDYVSVRVIDETERALRARRIFHDVLIRPTAYRDGVVDLEVLTRDSWTLEPGASLGRAGGVSSSRTFLRERNTLGSGVSVGVAYSSNVDRAGTEVSVANNNIGGSHVAASGTYANLKDGNQWALSLARPFYSLDTRWAVGGSASHGDVLTNIYEQGVKVSDYRAVSDTWDMYGGWSAGRVGNWTQRYSVGVSNASNVYQPGPGQPPASLPTDLTLTGPYLRFEAVEDAYEKARNRDQIGRAEFFSMGWQTQVQLGRALANFGSTESSWLYSASASKGFGSLYTQALRVNGGVSGRVHDGDRVNQLFNVAGRYYLPQRNSALFTASFAADIYRHPDVPAPLQLGGDTGLRGYPLSFQSGERRALLTLEERVYADWHPYRLIRVGGAVFADAGRAWSGAQENSAGERILTDWGVGLRLTDSRSSLGTVLHLDFAFPLNARDQVKSSQFVIKSQSTF